MVNNRLNWSKVSVYSGNFMVFNYHGRLIHTAKNDSNDIYALFILNFDSVELTIDKMVGEQNKQKEWTPKVEPKPKIGLKFRNYHEAYVFSKDYAKRGGFEVRKNTSIKMARCYG